ncbi:hypothetical protein A9Q83_15565 [Alphaproteobacteria bacterium 46_93_T64]|nr:hypothetical protein A9Q83_15565 [Alphaproteobacteria bacterium 46_93_T64]
MASWDALKDELDLWQEAGITATFWWRDDDLNEPTNAFDRLLEMRHRLDIPLTLAVIPDNVDPHIADDLDGCHLVQHGVTHTSHAKEGEKKSEFPASRSITEMVAELTLGKARMETLFEGDFYPFLVPPWNRVGEALLPDIAKLGFHGISRYKPRASAVPVQGLAEVNTHIDPVDWKNGRSTLAEADILKMACDHLCDRRLGRVDTREPTGFLSHHIMYDEPLWEITYKFFSFVNSHKAVRFLTLPGALSVIEEFDLKDFP